MIKHSQLRLAPGVLLLALLTTSFTARAQPVAVVIPGVVPGYYGPSPAVYSFTPPPGRYGSPSPALYGPPPTVGSYSPPGGYRPTISPPTYFPVPGPALAMYSPPPTRWGTYGPPPTTTYGSYGPPPTGYYTASPSPSPNPTVLPLGGRRLQGFKRRRMYDRKPY
jgi:hypothetical protein